MPVQLTTQGIVRLSGGYGWMPDLPDQRDYKFSAIYKIPAKLPGSVDLRSQCPPVEDQGNLGSCTANALAGALEFLELKDKADYTDLSRLFIYYNERVIEHTVTSDSGAMLRDGIKTLAKQGVCAEAKWPYAIARFTKKPSAACYKDASNHQITSYQRLLTVDEMRSCLADGYPFVFGFTVYESFESATVARTGTVSGTSPITVRTDILNSVSMGSVKFRGALTVALSGTVNEIGSARSMRTV